MSTTVISTIADAPTKTWVSINNRIASRTERGSQTAEYGVTVLVAVALALCVFGLITGGLLDKGIGDLLHAVLAHATALSDR